MCTRQLIKDTAHAPSFAALPARARACHGQLPCQKLCASGTTRSFPVCPIVSTKWPSPTFPTLLASVANFLANLLALLASTLQICTAILCMHCNLHCNCIRCRFCDQGMRNLHALQHLQDLQIGLQLCAICLQIWLAHVHACFSCQYFANLHCNCIRCRFSDQGIAICMRCNTCKICKSAYNCNCVQILICFIAFDCKLRARSCIHICMQ